MHGEAFAVSRIRINEQKYPNPAISQVLTFMKLRPRDMGLGKSGFELQSPNDKLSLALQVVIMIFQS
jgi:hypothetical protein